MRARAPFLARLQGFHKILKKHDKCLPHAPCRQFYVAHLHQQPWVQVSAAPTLADDAPQPQPTSVGAPTNTPSLMWCRWPVAPQGNYSDLLVALSNVHSKLRGDTTGEKNEDAAQVRVPELCAMGHLRGGEGGQPREREGAGPLVLGAGHGRRGDRCTRTQRQTSGTGAGA